MDIAKNDSDSNVRLVAIKKINNESVLIDIAKNDSEKWAREKAVKRINDEAALMILLKIVLAFGRVKKQLKKITDQSVLEYISKYDDYSYTKEGYTRDHDYEGGVYYPPETIYPVRNFARDRLKELGYN